MARQFAVGIDVGTGSARAGIVDAANGTLLAVHKRDLKAWSPLPEFHEQSSEDVWKCVTECVTQALTKAGVDPTGCVGVGFDATCSLVTLDQFNHPVSVDPVEFADERNIILWMDHRATEIAEAINATGHERLSTVGGVISPEMQMPKLLWLRDHLPDAFKRMHKALDLADYLAYRATDYTCDARSLCTVVCKWCYDANASGTGLGWDRTFLNAIGFRDDELSAAAMGGDRVLPPGAPIEGGLAAIAAKELGLPCGTPLAVGMIDAHAGGLGCLGAPLPGHSEQPPLTSRLALIAGTSACHMATRRDPKMVRGVWGPYYSAMLPGMYLNEGGISAAGALIDHIIETHPAAPELRHVAEQKRHVSLVECLNEHLEAMAAREGAQRGQPLATLATLASNLHVTPDFCGNRSPLADPRMRGAVIGLGLGKQSLDDLALLYLATVQALAYQTRHIIETLAYSDPPIEVVVACGGLAKNPLFVSTHADVLQLPIHTPTQEEAVLLGAAILGATAGGAHSSIEAAMAAMSSIGSSVQPQSESACRRYHEKKYKVFLRMNEAQLACRAIMLEQEYEFGQQ